MTMKRGGSGERSPTNVRSTTETAVAVAPDTMARSSDATALAIDTTPTEHISGAPFQNGEVVGARYRIDRVIGEGSMGVIVAATHIELDEPVAIKFLKHEFAIDRTIVGRFAREAKAAAKL